jgi:hypothetical protein
MRYNYQTQRLLSFEARFRAADASEECAGAQGGGVVDHGREKGRQGVVGDAEAGGDDIEIHDGFGDE